jgi:hypothetical protein
MNVVRSAWFTEALAVELSLEGRPSIAQFEDVLGEAVELTLATLWNDGRYVQVADSEHDIRVTATIPVLPFFPPAVFYAWPLDAETLELIAFEFDWDFYSNL